MPCISDEESYDLMFDPLEANDLLGDPALQPTLEQLRSHLQEWLEGANDPVLTDSIPPPAA